MKAVTLFAAIALVIQTIISFYYLLTLYNVVQYDLSFAKIAQPLFVLSNVGLLLFFIQLYQRQAKN